MMLIFLARLHKQQKKDLLVLMASCPALTILAPFEWENEQSLVPFCLSTCFWPNHQGIFSAASLSITGIRSLVESGQFCFTVYKFTYDSC